MSGEEILFQDGSSSKDVQSRFSGLLEEEDVSSVILKYFDNNDIIFRMREVSSAAKAAVENERCRDRHVPSTDAVSGHGL